MSDEDLPGDEQDEQEMIREMEQQLADAPQELREQIITNELERLRAIREMEQTLANETLLPEVREPLIEAIVEMEQDEQDMDVEAHELLVADTLMKIEPPLGRDVVAGLLGYLRQTADLMGRLALGLERQPKLSNTVAAHLKFMAELIRQHELLRMDEEQEDDE